MLTIFIIEDDHNFLVNTINGINMQAKEIAFSFLAKSVFVHATSVGTALSGDCRFGKSVERPRYGNQHNEAN